MNGYILHSLSHKAQLRTYTQGEDVVAGIRTPMKLSDLRKEQPAIFDTLMHIERILEKHFRDMQVSVEWSEG